jgi:hypothetical protein
MADSQTTGTTITISPDVQRLFSDGSLRGLGVEITLSGMEVIDCGVIIDQPAERKALDHD